MALLDQHVDSSFGIAGQFRRRRRWHLSLVAVASTIALAVLVALRSDHRNYVPWLFGADVLCIAADSRIWRCPRCDRTLGKRVALEDCPRCHVRFAPLAA